MQAAESTAALEAKQAEAQALNDSTNACELSTTSTSTSLASTSNLNLNLYPTHPAALVPLLSVAASTPLLVCLSPTTSCFSPYTRLPALTSCVAATLSLHDCTIIGSCIGGSGNTTNTTNVHSAQWDSFMTMAAMEDKSKVAPLPLCRFGLFSPFN